MMPWAPACLAGLVLRRAHVNWTADGLRRFPYHARVRSFSLIERSYYSCSLFVFVELFCPETRDSERHLTWYKTAASETRSHSCDRGYSSGLIFPGPQWDRACDADGNWMPAPDITCKRTHCLGCRAVAEMAF